MSEYGPYKAIELIRTEAFRKASHGIDHIIFSDVHQILLLQFTENMAPMKGNSIARFINQKVCDAI